MKIQTIFLFVLLAVFASDSLIAQYGYGNPYGYYGNRYGRQRSTIPQASERPKEPEKLTAEEIVDEQLPSITKALGLDPFEEAVVRTTLIKSVQQRIELQILELEATKMQEAVEKIRKRQDEELKAGLSPDKYEAFQELQKNRFKTKKKKEKKRKKKSNE